MVLFNGTKGVLCWKARGVLLLVNESVVGVVVGPVADNVTGEFRHTVAGSADAVTPVGAGFTVNG